MNRSFSRQESDVLGARSIPAAAYRGGHTARAVENFLISGQPQSCMPGKVNPVIPEVMNQVAFDVIGNDATITMAAESGRLQLNAFEPIIAKSLYKSVRHLRQACQTLLVNCVGGILANRQLLERRVAKSVTLVTALNPLIGYEKAALANRATIADTAEALGVMSAADVQALLVPEKLTRHVRLDE